jgi:hypothetical protein
VLHSPVSRLPLPPPTSRTVDPAPFSIPAKSTPVLIIHALQIISFGTPEQRFLAQFLPNIRTQFQQFRLQPVDYFVFFLQLNCQILFPDRLLRLKFLTILTNHLLTINYIVEPLDLIPLVL